MVNTQLLHVRVQNVHTKCRKYFRGFLNSCLVNFARNLRKLMRCEYFHCYSKSSFLYILCFLTPHQSSFLSIRSHFSAPNGCDFRSLPSNYYFFAPLNDRADIWRLQILWIIIIIIIIIFHELIILCKSKFTISSLFVMNRFQTELETGNFQKTNSLKNIF